MQTFSNYGKSSKRSTVKTKNGLVWFLALAIGFSSTTPVISDLITQREQLTTIEMPSIHTMAKVTSQPLKSSTPSETAFSNLTTKGPKEKKFPKCETTRSFCIINFYPDHPDAGRSTNRTNNNERIEKWETLGSNKTNPSLLNDNKYLFCTYYYPDHPDLDRQGKKCNLASTSNKNRKTSIASNNQKAMVSNEKFTPATTATDQKTIDCHNTQDYSTGTSTTSTGRHFLGPDQSLFTDQKLVNNGFTAYLQADGNFVIYNPDGDVEFATGTMGSGGVRFTFQESDGNVVLYTENDQPVWASHSSQPGICSACKCRLVLSPLGQLIVDRNFGNTYWFWVTP